MDNKKLIPIIVAVALLAGGLGFWYWSRKGGETPKEEKGGAVETAKNISESVPEIQTNPVEKIPEINPLDRVNPFKYKNPLR